MGRVESADHIRMSELEKVIWRIRLRGGCSCCHLVNKNLTSSDEQSPDRRILSLSVVFTQSTQGQVLIWKNYIDDSAVRTSRQFEEHVPFYKTTMFLTLQKLHIKIHFHLEAICTLAQTRINIKKKHVYSLIIKIKK